MKINVLILDDNLMIGDCIKKRIFKANEAKFSSSIAEIKPYYLQIDISKKEIAVEKIETFIASHEINFLLLDRGFYNLIDPKTNTGFSNLSSGNIYLKKNDEGIKIEQILKLVSKEILKKIKGLIVYTYDDNYGGYVEPAHIKQMVIDVMPDNFNKEYVDIVLSHSEVYNLSNLRLYQLKEVKNHPDLMILGKKAEFMLYGLFIGEILYHRIIAMVQKENERIQLSKQEGVRRNIILLFVIFTCLNLGGEALFNLLSKSGSNDLLLVVLSLGFALFLPIIILLLRPNWLINLDED